MHKFCLKCHQEIETENTTCPRCGSRLGIKKENGSYFFPATAITKEVPAFERAQLVCMIPEGRVATTEAIDAFFKRRYNCDSVRYAPPTPIFARRLKGQLVPIMIPPPGEEVETIPQWRVVSQRGFVDEIQGMKLQGEGVEVVESGRGYRVPAYKEIGVRFDRLLTEVKDAPVWTI